MGEYDKVCIETFLKDQLKLFPEKVAETPEEAEDFLDMCMAAVCKNMKEVREYFDETGTDIAGMSKEELTVHLEPARYIGRCPEQVDEFLNNCVRPVLESHAAALSDGRSAELKV